jgi:two-component sensor histidine kinase
MPEGHLAVVSYLAVPVIARSGEVIGGLFFGHDRAGVFTQDAEEIVSGIAAHAAIAIDNARLLASVKEEMRSKELLLNEFQHRMRNTLATVQAIAAQTLRNAPKEERATFVARLHALANVHSLLTERNWDRALVADVVHRAMGPFPRERFRIEGPDAHIDGNGSQLLALALHELATNAVKHGALSNGAGKISVTWGLENQRAVLRWQETDGPPVAAPARKGFGSVLVEQATAGKASLEFPPGGVVCIIELRLAPSEAPGVAKPH